MSPPGEKAGKSFGVKSTHCCNLGLPTIQGKWTGLQKGEKGLRPSATNEYFHIISWKLNEPMITFHS